LRQNSSSRTYTIMLHDMVSKVTTSLPINLPESLEIDISGNWIVYAKSSENMIFGYNIVDKVEKRLAEESRLRDGPVVGNSKVVWVSHVPKEKFKPIAGRPLINERDFRNLHVLDMDSGRVKTLAENQFMLRRPAFDTDGKIYSLLSRTVTTGSAQVMEIIRY
jgi:hypothetical protein